MIRLRSQDKAQIYKTVSDSEWLLKRYDRLSLAIMDRPRVSFSLLLTAPSALPVFWWRIVREFIITTPVV
jgi:hypothetical protein